jgi:hypothetical protein
VTCNYMSSNLATFQSSFFMTFSGLITLNERQTVNDHLWLNDLHSVLKLFERLMALAEYKDIDYSRKDNNSNSYIDKNSLSGKFSVFCSFSNLYHKKLVLDVLS